MSFFLSTVINKLKTVLIFLFLKAISLFCSPKKNIETENIRKILVFAYTGLGNFILFTPAIRALREAFPEAHITVQAGNDYGTEHVLGESDLINETLIIRHDAPWRQKIRFIRELRKQRYDAALVSFDCRSLFAMAEILLAGIPVRAGHTVEKIWGKDHLRFVFNFPVPLEAGRHEIDLKLDLVSVLTNQKVRRTPPLFHLNETNRQTALKLLSDLGLPEGKPFICVQPGAANAMNTPKRWPLEKFAVLLDRLIKELNVPVIALGDAAERQIVEKLQEMMEGKLYILAGKTGVKEAAAVIEKASLILCHDSGLMHVAVAVGTPVVALYGPTDYYRTRPLGEMHTVIKKDLDCSPCMYGFKSEADALKCPHRNCMNSIEPEEVFEVIRTYY